MSEQKQTIGNWVEERLPVGEAYRKHMSEYYAPKNFNIWYAFGVLAMVVLVNQLLTGIFLTMHYVPDAQTNEAGISAAFMSVEYIMRDVPFGWLIRYMHSTGASFFFIVVYLHMFRALMYGSYKGPRELLWLVGMVIFLVLMGEAFFGYLLPWGQMSYWGAKVIFSLFGTVPFVGESLQIWIQGDYVISGATLGRAFALHVVALPIVLLGLVFVHILALHHVGSNNPDGIDIKAKKDENGKPLDGIPFHPYYSVKDGYIISVFLIIFASVVFFAPEMGGYFIEKPNFEPANHLAGPDHVAPVWYFMPFYAILRAIPSPGWGALAMFLSIAVMFALPWLDRCKVRSIRYRSNVWKAAVFIFAFTFLILGYVGAQPKDDPFVIFSFLTNNEVARIFSVIYFLFFILMPFYTRNEKTKPLPERVTMPEHKFSKVVSEKSKQFTKTAVKKYHEAKGDEHDAGDSHSANSNDKNDKGAS